MGEGPQDPIRRYLDEEGGRADAFVGQLMDTWQLTTWFERDRTQVQEDLASVDVYSDPPLADTARNDPLVLFVAERTPRAEFPQGDPAEIVRHTVELNGGTYQTDARDLLGLFGRENLTDKARSALTAALAGVGVGVRPDLSLIERTDPIELFMIEPAAAAAAQAPPPVRRPSRGWGKLQPRSWKGWLAYGFVGLVLLAALTGDDPGERREQLKACLSRSGTFE